MLEKRCNADRQSQFPIFLEEIREALNKFTGFSGEKTGPLHKRAAVLLPLVEAEGKFNLLYTRRSDTMQDHKGQVSFPGGGREPQDSCIEETAIREACEEVGLCREDIHILGRMSSMISISGFNITPIVGNVARYPFPLRLEIHEVERAFLIPLAWLSDARNYEERPRIFSDGRQENVIYYQLFDGELLWGITARITQEFLKVIGLLK